MELLIWDVWGVMPEPEDEITPQMVELFDALADIRDVHQRDATHQVQSDGRTTGSQRPSLALPDPW